jgi:tetratricopeptide (TPR) repeat protein
MGVAVYLSVVFSTVNEMSNQLQNLTLPDIDTTLVALMGLSQATFLGVKAANKTIEISGIYPLEVDAGKFISIFGANFGKKDTVWIGKRRIWRGDQEDDGLIWGDERIDLRIPTDLPPDEYEVKVVKGGERAIAKEKLTVQSSKSDYKSAVGPEIEKQHDDANPGPATKSQEHLIMEARDYYQNRLYKIAIDIIDKVLEKNPKNVEALNEKGKALDKLNKPDEAILYYKRAVSIDPKYVFGWYNGALSYQDIDKSKAIEWLEKVIKLDPLNADAWHDKGKLLEYLGRTEDARESYKKSKALKDQYK